MKQFIALGLLAVFLTFANDTYAGDKVLVPSFRVKLNNFSSIANQNLKVRIHLDCSYSTGWVWRESKSCGQQVERLTVNSDGTFVVPNLNYLGRSSLKNYSFSMSIDSDKDNVGYIVLTQKEIKSAAKKLAQISIIELPDLSINVQTPTGEDYASWRGTQTNENGISGGPCVLLNLIWITETNGFHGYPEREGQTDKNVAGFLKGEYLLLPGKIAADLQVRAELRYWSSKSVNCVTNIGPSKTVDLAMFKDTIQNIQTKIHNSTVSVD
jgi:hypothetical protein